MLNDTKVNIIMSTYNGEKYLKEQLESLINQSYKNWFLTIRDDGSTDQTIDIINRFSSVDDRIKLTSDNLGNLKSCQSFGKLMADICGTSEYVMFCDQDDIWLKDKIERSVDAMRALEKNESSDRPLMVYGTYKLIDQVGNDLGLEEPDYSMIPSLNLLLSQNYIYGCTMLINKSLLGLSVPIPSTAENHDYWSALTCSVNGGNFSYIKKPLLLYRQHTLNVSGSYKNASIFSRVRRIFGIDEIQSIKNRLKMFISLRKATNDESSQNAILLDNYIEKVSIGGAKALKFCLSNNIRRKGFMQTILFYLNLLRTRRFE